MALIMIQDLKMQRDTEVSPSAYVWNPTKGMVTFEQSMPQLILVKVIPAAYPTCSYMHL